MTPCGGTDCQGMIETLQVKGLKNVTSDRIKEEG
jgi:hypothetical protein